MTLYIEISISKILRISIECGEATKIFRPFFKLNQLQYPNPHVQHPGNYQRGIDRGIIPYHFHVDLLSVFHDRSHPRGGGPCGLSASFPAQNNGPKASGAPGGHRLLHRPHAFLDCRNTTRRGSRQCVSNRLAIII